MGTATWVAGLQGHPLKSVAAWLAHMDLNQWDEASDAFNFCTSGDGAADAIRLARDSSHGQGCSLHLALTAGKVSPMRHNALVSAAKDMATLVGCDPAQVAGHSFRHGGATFAFQCGVPDVLIQRKGDWLLLCYREYITVSVDQALTATHMMFTAMSDTSKPHP